MAFVALAKIRPNVCRCLRHFGQKHAALIVLVQEATHGLKNGVRLRQIGVVGTLTFAQIWDGIETEAIHAEIEPEAHGLQHRVKNTGIGVVEVRLLGEKAMPVVGLSHRVPGPVRGLDVLENNRRASIATVCVAPDVEIARSAHQAWHAARPETRDAGLTCDWPPAR